MSKKSPISQEMMNALFERKEKLEYDLKSVRDAIESLQKICDHDYLEAGPLKKCTICQKTVKI